MNPDWHPYERHDPAAEGGDQPSEPQVYESERRDTVLYGPKGEVLRRYVDRPFRGYRGQP
jgi:hypothetical protein